MRRSPRPRHVARRGARDGTETRWWRRRRRGARDRVARVARVQVERERGRVRVRGAGLEPRADPGQVDVRVVEVVRQRGRERGERAVAALRGGRVEREFALEERAQRRVGRRRGNGRGGGHRRNARRAPRARAGGTTRAAGSASRVGEWRAGRGRDEAFSGTISTPGVFRGDVDWPISGRRFSGVANPRNAPYNKERNEDFHDRRGPPAATTGRPDGRRLVRPAVVLARRAGGEKGKIAPSRAPS